MDKLNYREIVQQILENHAINKENDPIQAQLIIDKERDHYQVFYVGWLEGRRIHGSLIHIDIVNNKIWIQCDKTEVGIANELLEMGIPKSDIVLGFQSESKRKFTEFAIS